MLLCKHCTSTQSHGMACTQVPSEHRQDHYEIHKGRCEIHPRHERSRPFIYQFTLRSVQGAMSSVQAPTKMDTDGVLCFLCWPLWPMYMTLRSPHSGSVTSAETHSVLHRALRLPPDHLCPLLVFLLTRVSRAHQRLSAAFPADDLGSLLLTQALPALHPAHPSPLLHHAPAHPRPHFSLPCSPSTHAPV